MASTLIHSQPELRQALLAEPDKQGQLLFAFNKHAIAAAMLANGLTEGVVTYNGGSDEGQIEGSTFEGQDADASTIKVDQAVMIYRWDQDTSLGGTELQFVNVPLAHAIHDLCEAAIELSGHNGFEDNEGGSGTFTLTAKDEAARLEHHDHYIESADSVHEL